MSDFRDDPNYPQRDMVPANDPAQDVSYLKWIFGGVVGALFLGVLAFAFTNDRPQPVATNERPNMSRPAASTTGSGGGMEQPAMPERRSTRP